MYNFCLELYLYKLSIVKNEVSHIFKLTFEDLITARLGRLTFVYFILVKYDFKLWISYMYERRHISHDIGDFVLIYHMYTLIYFSFNPYIDSFTVIIHIAKNKY